MKKIALFVLILIGLSFSNDIRCFSQTSDSLLSDFVVIPDLVDVWTVEGNYFSSTNETYIISKNRLNTPQSSQLSVIDDEDLLISSESIEDVLGKDYLMTIDEDNSSDSILAFGPWEVIGSGADLDLAYAEYSVFSKDVVKAYSWPGLARKFGSGPYLRMCPRCATIDSDTLYVFDWAITLDGSDSNYVANLFVFDLTNGSLVRSFAYDNQSVGKFNWFEPTNGVYYSKGYLYGGRNAYTHGVNTVTGVFDTSEVRQFYPDALDNPRLAFIGTATSESYFYKYGSHVYLQTDQWYLLPDTDSTFFFFAEYSGISLTKLSKDTLGVTDSIHFLREFNTIPRVGSTIRIEPFKTPARERNICGTGGYLYGVTDYFQNNQHPRISLWKVDTMLFQSIWERYYDLPFSNAVALSVFPHSDGGVVVHGFTTVSGNNTPWFYHVNANGDPVRISSSTDVLNSEQLSISIYPNPVAEVLNLDFTGRDESDSNVSVQLLNLNGKVLKSELVPNFALNGSRYQLDVSEIPSGTYYVRVSNNYKSWSIVPVVISH